jgi:hypothetical protein
VSALRAKPIGQPDHQVSTDTASPLSRLDGKRTGFNVTWTARHSQSASLDTVGVAPEVRNNEHSSSDRERAQPKCGQHTVKQRHCFQTRRAVNFAE